MIFKVCCREKLGCAAAEHAPRAALEAPPPLPLLPPRARGRWTLPGEEPPRSESGIVVARQSATCAPHLDARRDAFGVHIYICSRACAVLHTRAKLSLASAWAQLLLGS